MQPPREGTVLTITCSTGLLTSSPCIMACRNERDAQETLPERLATHRDRTRINELGCLSPSGQPMKGCSQGAEEELPWKCQGRGCGQDTLPGPGPAPGLLLPSGPGRTRCPGPAFTSHLDNDPVHASPPRAAHRDGPLAQPHAHGAVSTAAAKSSRRCRQILPPSLPPPPPSGAASRPAVRAPPAGRCYWLPGAVRRKCRRVPCRDAVGAAMVMALPVERWRWW